MIDFLGRLLKDWTVGKQELPTIAQKYKAGEQELVTQMTELHRVMLKMAIRWRLNNHDYRRCLPKPLPRVRVPARQCKCISAQCLYYGCYKRSRRWRMSLLGALFALFFLSSTRVEASHGDPSYTLCCNVQHSVSANDPMHPAITLVRTTRPTHSFPERANPILYVIKWPPIKSEAERLAEDAHERVTVALRQPPAYQESFLHKLGRWLLGIALVWAMLIVGLLYVLLNRSK